MFNIPKCPPVRGRRGVCLRVEDRAVLSRGRERLRKGIGGEEKGNGGMD